MYRLALISISVLCAAVPSTSLSSTDPSATYIMQVSSNLKCDKLDIELVSKQSDHRQFMRFNKGAFAATELPAGTYEFGTVICTKKNKDVYYDFLKNKIAPIELSASQAYFGGRIMFKQATNVKLNDTPEALDTCAYVKSNVHGDSDNTCGDVVGVSTSIPCSTQIQVFLPKVLDSEIAAVRTAMSASEEQLIYLPLKV